MTSSRYPHITDELLSAYIDDTVTEDEKALIEAAISNEPAIAWQLETLRYTVNLLNSLPSVALPRSFALSEIQMLNGAAQPALVTQTNPRVASPRPVPRPRLASGGFRQSWRDFWQIGNIFLRDAAAASLAIFLVLSVGNFFVTNGALATASYSPSTELRQTASTPLTVIVTAAESSAQNRPVFTPTTVPVQSQAALQQVPSTQAVSNTANSAPANAPIASVTVLKARTSAQSLRVGSAIVSPLAQAGNEGTGGATAYGAQSRSPNGTSDATEYAPEAPITAAAQPEQEVAKKTEPLTAELSASSAKISTDAMTGTMMTNTAAMIQPRVVLMDAETETKNTVSTTATLAATNVPVTNIQGAGSLKATTPTPTINLSPVQPNSLDFYSANKSASVTSYRRLLPMAQLGFALATLIFALLWWRSRMRSRQIVEQS